MPPPTSETDPRTFDWQKPERRSRGLAFWMFVTLLGLAGFFYLFQVVYPQAQRFTPVPHHVVVLSPADPAARELMNKVQDLDFMILPPPAERVGSANLEEHAPVFHPTFEGHKLQLQDLPQKTVTVPPARLLQMGAPVLPPLDLRESRTPAPAAKPAAGPVRLTMKLSGALASRGVERAPDLSNMTLNDPAACRFQLGVNAEGGVDVALPLASSENAETLKELTSVLQGMRFTPANGAQTGPMLGTATFQVSKATP
jgi:hypothetical protein